jgi:rod shape determining protein RodA
MALSTPRSRPGPDRSRRDLSAPWRHFDPILVVCTLAVAVLGTVMVFSATRGSDEVADQSFLRRQLVFMVIGVAVMAAVSLIDYRKLRDWAVFLYGGMVVLLILVVSPFGSEAKGAQAWFAFGPFQFQPSEFSKLVVIIALASLLAVWRGDIDLRRLGFALFVAGVPMGLIMLQPDLGTMLVFVAITMAMLLMGGVKGRHILILTVLGVVFVYGALQSNVLKEYQKDRLTVFIDPENANDTASYNLEQSLIAIQSGGFGGGGLFQGKQTQLRFVPEQQTDFIFTVVGEELGFIGGATFLALFATIVWRIWRTAALARDELGQLICVGVLAMLVFQLFESVGMTMGIMPVTGIPLPFMSYGGTTTIASFAAIGLVLNVHMRRFR